MDEDNVIIPESSDNVGSVQMIEIEESSGYDVELFEAFPSLTGNTTNNHALLDNREISDQHPITAITGLREELDEIQSLKTVYSDKIGVANYYEWYEGAYDECGFFVSLVPHTSTIKICDGSDIFGVTIDCSRMAGFIGGQNEEIPRGNNYGLVMTSGVVDVRCESDVVDGDYVISNVRGIAEKTTVGYGYKVMAVEKHHGVNYAIISLGVQADITNKLGADLGIIDTRLDNAEINIAAAMSVANQAYNKTSEIDVLNKNMSDKVDSALDTVDKVVDDVEDLGTQLSNSALIATQARAIAESAATSAESARIDAVAASTEALNKAGELEKAIEPISKWECIDPVTGEINTGASYFVEYFENGLSTKAEMETVSNLDKENKLLIEKNAAKYAQMLSSIDKYSVGEYSQAYGLTLEQAQNILNVGMVYIPTQHGNTDTHVEDYGDGFNREFTYGFYYVWMPVLEDDGTMWSEAIGEVWFGKEKPAGTTYDYWYDGNKLYLLNGEEYIEVALLAGNVNNRITSMIRQTAEEINAEVVNARGSSATLGLRLNGTEAEVQSLALWSKGGDENGEQYNLATIKQTADDAGADIALLVQEKNGEKVVNGASIIMAINDDKSGVTIKADHINLKGYVTVTDLSTGGKTTINGSNITTGSLQSANYITSSGTEGMKLSLSDGAWDSQKFKIDKNGNITATGGKIGGWNISTDTISASGIMLYSGTSKMSRSLVSGANSYRRISVGSAVTKTHTSALLSSDDDGSFNYVFDTGCHLVTDVKYTGSCTDSDNGFNILVATAQDNGVISANGMLKSAGTFILTITYSVPALEILADGSLYANATAISGSIKAQNGSMVECELSKCTIDDDCMIYGTIYANKISAYESPTEHHIGVIEYSPSNTYDELYFKITNPNLPVNYAKMGVYMGNSGYGDYGRAYAKMITYDYTEEDGFTEASIECAYMGDIHLYGGRQIILESPRVYSHHNITANDVVFGSLIGCSQSVLGTSGLSVNIKSNKTWDFFDYYGDTVGRILTDTKDGSPFILYSDKKISLSGPSGANNRFFGSWTFQEAPSGISDKNFKNSIDDIPDIYDAVFDGLRPVVYKYNDGTSNRLHTGFIAQEVYESIRNAGMTFDDFAGVCITDRNTDHEVWTLRYDEFVALNTNQIQKLKVRIAELEQQVNLLLNQN